MNRVKKGEKHILLTGGLGYVGSHICVELQKRGYKITVIDDQSNSYEKTLERITNITKLPIQYRKVDMTEREELEQAIIDAGKVDLIIHLASIYQENNALLNYRINVLSLLNLLETMDKLCIHNLVFSSSSKVYGTPETQEEEGESESKYKLSIREDEAEPKPVEIQGKIKLFCENMIRDVTKRDKDWRVISLRSFNITGAHDTLYLGENKRRYCLDLVSNLARSILRNKPFPLYGIKHKTRDGTCVKDYVHVMDVARAYALSVEKILKDREKNRGKDWSYENINLCGGNEGVSVGEILKEMGRISGRQIMVKEEKARREVEYECGNANKAWEILGWKAEKTLADMLRSVWYWELKKEK